MPANPISSLQSFISSLEAGSIFIGNTKIDSLESLEISDNTQSMELPILGTDIRPLITKEGVSISYSMSFNIFADTPKKFTDKVQKLIIQLNTFPVISLYSIKLFYILYNPLMGLKDVTEENIKAQYKNIIEEINEKIKEYNKTKKSNSTKSSPIPPQGGAIPIIVHNYKMSLDNTKLNTYHFDILFSVFNFKPFMQQLLYAKTPQTCLYKYITSVVDTSKTASYKEVESYFKNQCNGNVKLEYTPFTIESSVYRNQIDDRLNTKNKRQISPKFKPTVRLYNKPEEDISFKNFKFNLSYHLYTLSDIQGFINSTFDYVTNIIKNIDADAARANIKSSKPGFFTSLNSQITRSLLDLQNAVDTVRLNINDIKEYLKDQTGEKKDSYSFDTSPKNHLFSVFALSNLIPDNIRSSSKIPVLNPGTIKSKQTGVLSNIFSNDYLTYATKKGWVPFQVTAAWKTTKEENFTKDWYKTGAILASYAYAINTFYLSVLYENNKNIEFDPYRMLEKFEAAVGNISMIVEYPLSNLTNSFSDYLVNTLMSKNGVPLNDYKKFIEKRKVPLFLLFYGILNYLWANADSLTGVGELSEFNTLLKDTIKTTKVRLKEEDYKFSTLKDNFINKIYIDLLQVYKDSYKMFERAMTAMFGVNTINYKIDLYNNQIVPQNISIQKEFSRPMISLTKYLQPTTQFMGKSNYKIQMSFICQDADGLVKLRHFAELIDVQKKLLKQRIATARMINYGYKNDRMINNDFLLNEDKIRIENCPLFKSLGIEYIKINNLSISTLPDKPDNYVVNLDIIEDNNITPALEKIYAINALTPDLKMEIYKQTYPEDPLKLLKILNGILPGDMLNYIKRLYPLMDVIEDSYLLSKSQNIKHK
ncbi:MAG: hypothetical protein ACTSQY_10095, partial [Candidatus Odinarchaeia archaeon]